MEACNLILYWIYCTLSLYMVAASSGSRRCSFPQEWRGKWFQNGLGDVDIRMHSISHIGHCVSHNGHNKYLLLNRHDMCFMCLAFTPQHRNLLQYKQSYCVRSDVIEEVCDMITGDFQLHTMVKVPGSPIPCPFQGHYGFSYTNGSEAKCDNPLSSIQACADSSRFLFHHQHCPHVSDTNNKVESFQCLATWDNGVDHYLYGRFTGPLLTTKESQYRCFMYSLYGSHGSMSMTADATCQGLQSPSLGMNVYHLRHKAEEWPQPRCQFPQFFRSVKEWRDVNSRQKFMINKREDGFKVTDILDPDFVINDSEVRAETRLKVSCIGEVDSVDSDKMKTSEILAFVTDDKCQSNYRCIRFKQRSEKVVDLIIGQATEQTEYACQDSFLRGAKKQVLIPFESPPTACPMPGIYNYDHKSSECSGELDIGCTRDSEIIVDGRCPGGESADVLQCYATWTENDRVYVIAGRVGDLRRAADCLVYKVSANGYEMEADPECGSERLSVLGQPVEFIIKSPSKQCSVATTRPSPVYPAQSQESRDQTGIYDTNKHRNKGIHSSEIIKTPPNGGKKNGGVINANNGSWHLSASLLLCFGAVFLHLATSS